LVDNPFLKYRTRLDSYRRAIDGGWTDSQFGDLVNRLDASIASVEGHGFAVTPLTPFPELHPGGAALWVKDDTGNVGGSHKSRHLFGVLLAEAVDRAAGGDLAIASCGNAAIAASVIARATDRPLHVFIPTWADQAIVDVLLTNGALIEVCPRRSGESGDPTYLRFLEAVSKGATPFSYKARLPLPRWTVAARWAGS
jgi:threonine synthase